MESQVLLHYLAAATNNKFDIKKYYFSETDWCCTASRTLLGLFILFFTFSSLWFTFKNEGTTEIVPTHL